MADNQSPLQHPIPPEREEQDVLFKAQMWVYDLVVSYWKLGAYAVGLVLLGTLVYGLWDSWQTHQARKGAAAIAAVDRTMPETDQMAMMGLVPMDNLSDPERVEKLTRGAEGYEQAARDSSGAGAAHAWLKAADTWQRLGEKDKARAAYTSALDARDDGMFGHSARVGLAAMALADGKTDEAETQYREAAKDTGFLGESALLAIVDLKVQQGDTAGAQKALDEARTRFPTSPRVEETAKSKGLTLAGLPAPAETGKSGG